MQWLMNSICVHTIEKLNYFCDHLNAEKSAETILSTGFGNNRVNRFNRRMALNSNNSSVCLFEAIH